jgi:rhomboid protease GluP
MANCSQCGRKLPAFSFKKICQWCVQHEAAQRGEIAEDARQHVMPAPWIRRETGISLTQILFGANVAVYLAMSLSAGSIADLSGLDSRPWGANYGPLTLSGQWWRLLTYMFLHHDILHIAFNMWCLWDLGALCESLYGRWTFLSIYLFTGAAGGLASVAWHPWALSVGASGAIFGLAGALVASLALGEFSLPGVVIRTTLRSLVFFVAINVFFGYGFNLFGGSFGRIDNAAHAGGLVSGLVLGAMIAIAAPDRDHRAPRLGVLVFAVLLLTGSAYGVLRWRGAPFRFERTAEMNLDRTIAGLRAEIQRNPKNASTHYSLAQAYFARQQFPEGESELKRVLDLQPQNVDAQIDLGSAYLNDRQPKEAQEVFTRLLAQDQNNVDAHVGLGMSLADEQDHQSAIREYQSALQIDPKVRGVLYRMGISQAQLKEYDDAIASYVKERDQNGDDPELETALANAYQAKGMAQQAQQARDKAAQLESQNVD